MISASIFTSSKVGVSQVISLTPVRCDRMGKKRIALRGGILGKGRRGVKPVFESTLPGPGASPPPARGRGGGPAMTPGGDRRGGPGSVLASGVRQRHSRDRAGGGAAASGWLGFVLPPSPVRSSSGSFASDGGAPAPATSCGSIFWMARLGRRGPSPATSCGSHCKSCVRANRGDYPGLEGLDGGR